MNLLSSFENEMRGSLSKSAGSVGKPPAASARSVSAICCFSFFLCLITRGRFDKVFIVYLATYTRLSRSYAMVISVEVRRVE